jgi:hypothetical protein
MAVTDAQKVAAMTTALEEMANGRTLQDAAKAQGVPANALRKWLVSDPEWQQQYTKARLLQGQAMAEEAIRVARETTNHSSAADRLLIETLKWAASKANPQEFGDKQTVEHQGAPTLQVKIVEDDIPVRNPKAVGDAVAQAVIAVPLIAQLPAPKDVKILDE